MLKSSVEQDLVSKVKLPFSFKGNRAVTHLAFLTIYAEIQAIVTFKGKKNEELKTKGRWCVGHHYLGQVDA